MNLLKTSIIFLTALSSFSAQARFNFDLEIISTEAVLLDTQQETEIEITDETFIQNIQGYACAVPAIQIYDYQFGSAELKHARIFEFGVSANHEALIIKQAGGAFCSGFNGAVAIFGEGYLIGSRHKITVRTLRSIIIAKDWDGSHRRMLLEVVSSELLGVKLESTASLLLEPARE